MQPVCETPIWPPYAYPPPLPWYYGGPPYDPMHYMPAAPPYYVFPPSATTAFNSNQSSLPQHSETARGDPDLQPVTVEPSKPTVVLPTSFHEPAASDTDKLFRPLATRSCFRPTAGSLFKPVTSSDNRGCRQVSRSEPLADEKLSLSLLEMVELITPQLDSGTEHASENSDVQDDAEDEAEREVWEAEERERQRIRRRHTRQWMRALRTDIDQTQLSDTSV